MALSLAIATMLVMGGPFSWADALRFSSTNWLPWAILTPIVFWVSQRFPLIRGHLLRSIPLHLLSCLACTFVVSSIAQRFPLRTTTAFAGLPPSPTFNVRRIEFVPPEGGALLATSVPPQNAVGFAVRPTLSQPPASIAIGSGIALGPVPDAAPAILMSSATLSPIAATPTVAGVFAGNTLARPPWQMMLVPLALRANVGFLVYFIVAAAAHAIAFYRHAKDRERQALALVASRNQAKLDALRLQLQPHFLFNALNAIATLVHRDARAADRLLGDLSDLLRASLHTTQHEVTLASELELLEHYLAIEEARLGDRLNVLRDIDPSLMGACVPPLLLQPIAENAIRHGFESRLAPGTLTIAAKREGDCLCLTVADNGVGLMAARNAKSPRGIGLANTRERLRTLYGDAASLAIAQRATGGVKVRIGLPLRWAKTRPGRTVEKAGEVLA